jgi:hypothetical protein
MARFAVTRLRQFGQDAMMRHELFVDYVEYCDKFQPDDDTWITRNLVVQIEEAFDKECGRQSPWEMTETEKVMFLWLSGTYDVYVMSTPRGLLAFHENDTRIGMYCHETTVRVVHRLWSREPQGAIVVDLHNPESFEQIEAFIAQKQWPKRSCVRKRSAQSTS